MKIWEAVVLGIVQGASEFLPISSSGHLFLLEKLGVGEESLFFNVCLHVGTLLSVLIALRGEWIPLVKNPLQKKTAYIFIACVPTVLIAVIFKVLAPDLLTGKLLGFGFILTACLLFLGEKRLFAKEGFLDVKTSILTGIMQGIAVLPGISRSGSTIACMSMLGMGKEEAANFSFLLSIPIIIGSALLEGGEVIFSDAGFDTSQIAPVIVGTVCALISGYISIGFFLKMIKRRSLMGFALYTLLLGIVVTILPLFVKGF